MAEANPGHEVESSPIDKTFPFSLPSLQQETLEEMEHEQTKVPKRIRTPSSSPPAQSMDIFQLHKKSNKSEVDNEVIHSGEEREADHRYPYSRCSSTGSIHTLTSSANNTDVTDDEDSDRGGQMSYKERRREAHTQAEQKRRNAINKGYDSLQDLVPTCQNSEQGQGCKMSKATVLQKSIDYIQFLKKEKSKQEEEVAALKKEVVALTIMKLNYEQIVSAHQSQPGQHSKQISDDVKFQVFRAVMDSLHQSFDQCVSTKNFAEISGSVISWVEEHCKPQILREIMVGVLQQLANQEPAYLS